MKKVSEKVGRWDFDGFCICDDRGEMRVAEVVGS